MNIWVWRSLVACLNGVQEAGSSNLLTQTTKKPCRQIVCRAFAIVGKLFPEEALERAEKAMRIIRENSEKGRNAANDMKQHAGAFQTAENTCKFRGLLRG